MMRDTSMTPVFTSPLTALALFTAAILAFSSPAAAYLPSGPAAADTASGPPTADTPSSPATAELDSSPATANTPSSPAMADTPGRGRPSDGRASFSIGLFSNLVWRGQELNTGASIQPMVDLAAGGFGINLWSNFDVDEDYIRETDVTVNFAGSRDKLGYDVGFIYYGLRNPTFEIYATVKYDTFLSPYATFYLDIDAGQGGFLKVGIGHPVAVTDNIAIQLDAYASVNFENRAMGVDQNGETFTDFYNMDFSAKTSIPIAGDWSFDMQLAYSFPLSEAGKSGIISASATGKHNVLYGGIGVSRPF